MHSGTWLITRTESEGGAFRAGATLRTQWPAPSADSPAAIVPGARAEVEEPDGREWVSGIVTVVSAEVEEPAGGDAGKGRRYVAHVRAATTAEAAHVLLGEETHQRREALARRVSTLLAWGGAAPDDVTYPDAAPLGVLSLPSVPLSPAEGGEPGRSLRFDRDNRLLWTVVSVSEGASCGLSIAVAHPLTSEREQLVRDLFAEYLALHDWCTEGGYEPRAAEMLAQQCARAGYAEQCRKRGLR